jgi:hypothetical protein
MRKTLFFALASPIALAFPRFLSAQIFVDSAGADPQASAAYLAIASTPLGALPPFVAALAGMGKTGIGFRGQFGLLDMEGSNSFRTLALGVDIPVGRGSVGLTGGLLDFACDEDQASEFGLELDCKRGFMIGVNWLAPLSTGKVSEGGASFTIGIDGTVGFEKGDVLELRFPPTGEFLKARNTSLSAALGLPLALVARSGTMALVPHLTPRFAYGRLSLEFEESGGVSEEDSESGTRFMLGGGLELLFGASGFGIDLGFQKVFIEDGDTVLGFGLSYQPR